MLTDDKSTAAEAGVDAKVRFSAPCAQNRRLFESAAFSSIAAADAKGVVRVKNAGAERTAGYTAAEVMNKITPAETSDSQKPIARAGAHRLEFSTQIAGSRGFRRSDSSRLARA